MNDLIVVSSVDEVVEAYKNNGVSLRRSKAVNDKFTTMPDNFTVHGLIFPDITVSGKVNKNIPAFQVHPTDKAKYVLVGQFMSAFTDKTTASVVTKKNDDGTPTHNTGKFLVVNNRKVNAKIADNRSEAEVIVYAMGKNFNASPARDFPVYSGVFTTAEDGKISVNFHDTEAEAVAAIKPKSYRVISVAD